MSGNILGKHKYHATSHKEFLIPKTAVDIIPLPQNCISKAFDESAIPSLLQITSCIYCILFQTAYGQFYGDLLNNCRHVPDDLYTLRRIIICTFLIFTDQDGYWRLFGNQSSNN
jgi:hypothetical protein